MTPEVKYLDVDFSFTPLSCSHITLLLFAKTVIGFPIYHRIDEFIKHRIAQCYINT